MVETAIVQLQPVQTRVITYGRVTSSQPVLLHAEVAGTLEPGTVPFKPAQSFSKGDMLVKMSIKYDSVDALETVEQVCQIFRDTAYEVSINLAREKGSFPNFDWEQYNKSKSLIELCFQGVFERELL